MEQKLRYKTNIYNRKYDCIMSGKHCFNLKAAKARVSRELHRAINGILGRLNSLSIIGTTKQFEHMILAADVLLKYETVPLVPPTDR